MLILQKNSVAKKYVLILVFSLLPFIIGITYSLFQSNDRAYYSAAINISGSQRMRTMLLSNYSQQYVSSTLANQFEDMKNAKEVLLKEKVIYDKFYNALLNGESSLDMKRPDNEEIAQVLKELEPFINNYLLSIESVLIDYNDKDSLKNITKNAMYIKDQYHIITELFQLENDHSISRQRYLDILMIILAALITISGLFLTNRIKQQEYHAYYDFLTKLKNRHSFYHDIEGKNPSQYSIFFIDLNKFKVINDTYGHQIGDEILIGVAGKLRETFDTDLLYRFGGDEFIAILPTIGDEILIDDKIKTLKNKLAEPIIDSSNRRHLVGLALGVVSSQVGVSNWDTLISLSDDLMYDSKSIAGHVIVYRTKEDLDYRLKLINSVDHVFKNGLIKLSYSRIECLRNDSVPIYNVSSRWIDRNQVFRAKEFLPLLKRKGYLPMLDRNTIVQLEQDLLQKMQLNQSIDREANYIISVTEDTLINAQENQFVNLISTANIPVEHIYFKVQDEWLTDQGILRQLQLLKERGFKIALDLNKLELSLNDASQYGMVDLIKLGNSLVRTLMPSDQTRVLMKEFVNWITDLSIVVVMEGLTVNEHLDHIKCLDFRNKNLIYVDADNELH